MVRVASGQAREIFIAVSDHVLPQMRVKEVRIAKGLTRQELAIRAGLHVPHIANIENGKQAVTLTTLSRIAYALGVPISELIVEEAR